MKKLLFSFICLTLVISCYSNIFASSLVLTDYYEYGFSDTVNLPDDIDYNNYYVIRYDSVNIETNEISSRTLIVTSKSFDFNGYFTTINDGAGISLVTDAVNGTQYERLYYDYNKDTNSFVYRNSSTLTVTNGTVSFTNSNTKFKQRFYTSSNITVNTGSGSVDFGNSTDFEADITYNQGNTVANVQGYVKGMEWGDKLRYGNYFGLDGRLKTYNHLQIRGSSSYTYITKNGNYIVEHVDASGNLKGIYSFNINSLNVYNTTWAFSVDVDISSTKTSAIAHFNANYNSTYYYIKYNVYDSNNNLLQENITYDGPFSWTSTTNDTRIYEFILYNKTTDEVLQNIDPIKKTVTLVITNNGGTGVVDGGSDEYNPFEDGNNPLHNFDNVQDFDSVLDIAGNTFSMFKIMFSFLPTWIWIFVSTSLGLLLILRFAGR